jgi:endonuclease G, mitochondrial
MILVYLFLNFIFFLQSSDVAILNHKSYTAYYSKDRNYPVKVEWWLTKKVLTCSSKIPRTDKFLPDPLLKAGTDLQSSYTSSGFDRGHNYNAADGACDAVSMAESFYFSNMTAQYPALNRGDWKSLEEYTRKLALEKDSVKVICGSSGVLKRIGKVAVPISCWKVIYIKSEKKAYAYLFTNDTSRPDGFENNKVPLEVVKAVAEININL